MLLSKLLKEIKTESSIPEIDIIDISCDSRKVQKGSLFFALPGFVSNGEHYIAEAVKGGASAIVSQKEVECSVPVITVKNSRQTLAKAAAAYYGHATQNFYLCGITGTNGKTTLTYLLEKLWTPEKSGVMGTINIRFKNKILPTSLTTPDAITVQKIFSQMAKSHVEFVAIEASSHALEQSRVSECEFDAAVFTNLSQDHLDYHGDMESYYQSKLLLFKKGLQNSSKKNKIAVVNIDDPYGKRLVQDIHDLECTLKTFSVNDNNADIFVKNTEYTIHNTKIVFGLNQTNFEMTTNLLGEFNVKNIMAAILVALHQGYTREYLSECFQNVSVPGRLQRVRDKNFFVDYAHTPDALYNVMGALKQIIKIDKKADRLIVVFGCGGDRDKTKRPLMGRAVGKLADVALVTSDNPRTEQPNDIIEDILPGLKAYQDKFDGRIGYLVEVDRKSALLKAVQMARPQDVVLVAGKGHEDYQIIGKEKIHFDDVEILTELLGS